MGEKSRTPSVEARVVETKQKLSGSLEKLFLLYLHLFYSVSIVLIFFLHLFFCYFSTLFYTDFQEAGIGLLTLLQHLEQFLVPLILGQSHR